ncbi:MAG: hypothetical protein JNK46_09695 [Methylobacteriaceae bacterium]|nr:hypothetical protein [Methylobacteriaceae bacterium]
MRKFAIGTSILVGVGFATLVASSAIAAPGGGQTVAQAGQQQRLVACQREAQFKVVGNRASTPQDREAYVRRCMGAQ